jgi:hypothetical protein
LPGVANKPPVKIDDPTKVTALMVALGDVLVIDVPKRVPTDGDGALMVVRLTGREEGSGVLAGQEQTTLFNAPPVLVKA